MAARTTSSGYGSPTPQAWLRKRRSWSSGRAAGRLLDQFARGAHPPAAVLGEASGHALDRDRPDVLDPEIVAVQEHGRGNRHREQV
jgi:hypothetical protein